MEAKMAYHFFRVGKQSGKKFREYNLDFSVGESAFNHDDDVRLVQTLLHIAYFEPTSDGFRARNPPLPDVKDVEVDGICGPITKRYIAHFKKQAREIGQINLHPDKVMDPFRDNDVFSVGKFSGTMYAFAILLQFAGNAQAEKGGSNWVDEMIEEERTHPKLKAALLATRKQARQYAR
jgi:peptidoglycan hydrolase-like protein with peptidoglycan-binding domain